MNLESYEKDVLPLIRTDLRIACLSPNVIEYVEECLLQAYAAGRRDEARQQAIDAVAASRHQKSLSDMCLAAMGVKL
jgi:hypothetical protein